MYNGLNSVLDSKVKQNCPMQTIFLEIQTVFFAFFT